MIELPKFEGLEFEEQSHTYRLNGIVIPSVTTIMGPLNEEKYRGISESTLSNAADKGTAVHNSIENWIDFGFDDIPPEHRGYFDGFLDWWKKNEPTVIGTEIKGYHKTLRYGGTIDLLCIIKDEITLVDYKTTYAVSDMTFGVQLEGYAQILSSHGLKVQKKKILHLHSDRRYDEIEYPANDAERWRVFGSLKCVYDYIHK